MRKLAAPLILLVASVAAGQTTGAQLLKQPKPEYPDAASKGLRQGNVNLIGRIDTKGRVQDLRYVGSTIEAFVDPAVVAVNGWEFRPAMRGGKPVEIAANIALRFRLEGNKRGEITSPIVGDLSVFPADANGRSTAPDGFPIRRGTDPKIRVEAVLDVNPEEKPRNVAVMAEAISPIGKKVQVYQQALPVKAKTAEVRIPFTVTVDPNWEDGVWLLRFVVDNKTEAGGGQFWVAVDPDHYQFVLPGKPVTVAAAKKEAPPGSAKAPQPKATAAPGKKKS